MHRIRALRALCAVIPCLVATPLAAQQPAGAAELSLDSLLNVRISAASKYGQRSAEAPASVSIITADEIKHHGYRTLGEILENVRGFYTSNDRIYPALGTRGFSRPSDYNNRVLLLVDGHTINESLWGSAPVGSDLPINLDAIERIEIARGPASAQYGTRAMFAVINIVTRTGTQLDGAVVSARAGSAGLREGGFAAGHSFGATTSLALSAQVSRMDGERLTFQEFESLPGGGVVRGLDWEEGASALASLTVNEASVRLGFRSRERGMPTAPFAIAVGDPRARVRDADVWASVHAERAVSSAVRLGGRASASLYEYGGVYPVNAGPAATDEGTSTSAGLEGMLTWDPTSRHRLVAGVEYRHVFRARYVEQHVDGTSTADDAPFQLASFFAQGEVQLRPSLSVVAGMRAEQRSAVAMAFAPRVALVSSPDRLTTVKLLYGEAFRAPTPAEAFINTTFYSRNPSLQPERIRATELEVQRRVNRELLLSGSIYEYRIEDLIEQMALDVENGVQFHNVGATRGRGAEMQADLLPDGPISARGVLGVQRTRDLTGNAVLSNSPERVGSLSLLGRHPRGLRASTTVRMESGRRALIGSPTPAFVRTDVTLGYAPATAQRSQRGTELMLRVTNLFDTRYATPAGREHPVAAVPREGRMVHLGLSHRLQ